MVNGKSRLKIAREDKIVYVEGYLLMEKKKRYCPDCGGVGYHSIYSEHGIDEADCSTCDGTGLVEDVQS